MKRNSTHYRFLSAVKQLWFESFKHVTGRPSNQQLFCWLNLHDYDLARLEYAFKAAANNPALHDVPAIIRYVSGVANRLKNEAQARLAA